MNSKTTYHQQISYCGKPRCSRCREGIGHGPYWYAYKTENGRTTRTYIGKTLPASVQAEIQAEHSDTIQPQQSTPLQRKASQRSSRANSAGESSLTLLEQADLAIAREDAPGALALLDRILASEPTNEEATQRCIYLLAHLKRRGEALRAYKRLEQLLEDNGKRIPNQTTRDLFDAVKHGRDPRPLLPFAHAFPSDATSGDSIPSTKDAGSSQPITPPAVAIQTQTALPRLPIGRPGQSPLVGRSSELDILRTMLDEIEQQRAPSTPGRNFAGIIPLDTQRRPQCVFLMGDSGIGKTRLAEELSRQAQRRGWTVTWSRGYPQESGIPYHIWTDTLRKIMTESGLLSGLYGSFGALPSFSPTTPSGLTQKNTRLAVQERPSSSSTTRGRPRRLTPKEQTTSTTTLTPSSQWQPLTTLLPELASLYANLHATLHPSYLSPEQEQLRLHEAVHNLLCTASETAPLLIVLDDIQWTDVSSGDLLGYLARHVADRPILFLATCRDSELSQQPPHPLRVLISHMRREHSVRSLQLEPLSSEEIARLVSHLPEERIQLIQAQAAGNPFFAEELARSKPPTLPSTITSALEHRIQNLSRPCQQLLGSAAVLGGSFEFNTLFTMESTTSTVDEDTVIEQLEEALQSGVLNEETIGSRAIYHFWHPMLVTYLYDHVSATRRARLHRRAARVLQDMYAGREDEVAATIVHHLVLGDTPAASIVYYARLAAERAYALSAYAEAERHYRLALDYLDRPATSLITNDSITSNLISQHRAELENIPSLRVSLLERLAECAIIRGHFSEARSLYEQVLNIRDIQQPPNTYEAQKRALLWGEVGRCWRNASDTAMARTCCEHGEIVLRQAGITSGPAWARLRYQQGSIYHMEGNYIKARQAASESLDFFASQQTINLVGPIIQATRIERALAGDPVDLGNTHRLLGALADADGRANDALEHLETALFIFEQADHKRLIAHVCCDLSYVHLKTGNFEEAEAALRRSLILARSVDDDPLIGVISSNYGELHAARGELEEAENWYRRALSYAQNHKDRVYISQWNSRLATVLLAQGKVQEASSCVMLAMRTARAIHNIPSLGRALVSLGNHRISQAQTMEALPTIYHRLLLHARKDLEYTLTLDGLETETRIRARLGLAQVEALLEHPEANEHLLSAIHDARDCHLAQLVEQGEDLQSQFS
ncbi:DUF6788 family protein [Ktedonospora formicarum]|uniref:Bacterial transcriptional activator domain-containing protein n=1 Tax=Ktedonospora formicarum TaxID=2778364 RepID=A0A8J3MSS8_9CHLR|nr:DUF6788 family protein [Ktedonospora formicarum]GHO46435.1 hypothetical protein KSX_45980 [Ktedonospora formicarum]